jgi:cytochrome b subunit of formate dehydrogenase
MHLIVILSFTGLAITGMMLKYSIMPWAKLLADVLGGVEVAAKIHRLSAMVIIGLFCYHLFWLWRRKRTQKTPLFRFLSGENSLMFNKQDIKDFIANIKWFFGRGPRPQYGRWTYWEKFDYLAVFWGLPVIGLSGLILWFPEFLTHLMPGWIINVATIVHGDEALLAVGFIFTIHFFNTHLRPEAFPMDPVIFTGVVPLDEYRHDRPRHYQELKATGMLRKMVVKMEPSPRYTRLVYAFGFFFLLVGIITIFLIMYSMILGHKFWS